MPGQVCLGLARFGQAQIVETEIGGQMRLIMTGEKWTGFGDIDPFGEALAPPGIVLRDGMKLREVESDEAR